MKHDRLTLLLLAACGLFAIAPALAAPREMTIQQDTFGDVALFAPQDEPRAFVIYLSDDASAQERQSEIDRFVAEGVAVAALSTRSVVKDMERHADANADCFYVLGEFEDLSTTAQRALQSTAYRWPVIVGNGAESGTLAYLAIAQAPDNTAAGAVSIGFQDHFSSRLPLCPGAKSQPAPGGFIYAPASDIPGRWVLIADSKPPPQIAAFVAADPGNELRIASAGRSVLDVALEAALDIGAPPATSLADLPLVELPANGKISAFAIFLSGDGGWRDIDKSIAETLSQSGLSVVGLDSLRYFWKEKSPDQIARDLERIVAHYEQKWQAQRVVLLGFSMGADVIPPVWAKLSPATRDKIQLIALMGLEPTALYEISIAGYLGVNSAREVDIRGDLKTLPPAKVMCFYGIEEKENNETACILPELDGVTRLERQGGHHLDGNYEAIAKAILDRVHTPK